MNRGGAVLIIHSGVLGAKWNYPNNLFHFMVQQYVHLSDYRTDYKKVRWISERPHRQDSLWLLNLYSGGKK